MPLVSAPAVVTQLRDQLLLCPVVTGAGISTDDIYYPKLTPSGEDADPMPCMVIAELVNKRTKYAEGAIGLASGMLGITIYCDAATFPSVGAVETFARQISLELSGQPYGIHFREIDTGLSSDLSPGQRAAEEDTPQSAYRSIQITINYGLSR